jgi:hypothetical protein
MENNKTYVNKLGIIFLISLATVLLVTWLSMDRMTANYSPYSIQNIILEFLPTVIILVNIGIATKKWNAAVGGMAIFVLLRLIMILIKFNYGNEQYSQALVFTVYILIYLLPYMLFFLFAGIERAKLPYCILGVLLLLGNNGLYAAQEGFEPITRLFHIQTTIPRYIFWFLVQLVAKIIHVLLVCELLNYGTGKMNGFKPRLLNPGNEYDKAGGTIIFWTLKAFIFLSVLGCLGSLKAFIEFSDRSYSSMRFDFLKWYYLLSLTAVVPLVLAAAWYLRKFMLEFFISHQQSSRFLYWFLTIPLLGFFGWLFMLADADKNYSYDQRKRSLENFASASREGVVVVFIVLLALRLLLTLTSAQPAGIITVLISAGLLFALVSSIAGYFLNFYLNLGIMTILLIVVMAGSGRAEYMILYPLLLFNLAQLTLILPAFHFTAFDYIAYEEEKPWQPGDDLF